MSTDAFSIDLDESAAGGALDLDRLLEEQPGGGTGEGGGEGGTGGGEDLDAARKANKALADQLAQSQRQIEDMQQQLSRFDTTLKQQQNAPKPAAPPPGQPFNVEEFKNSMAELLVRDPGEYSIRMFEAARRSVEQDMLARFGGVATTTASLETQNFLANKQKTDATFDDATHEAFLELAGSPEFAQSLSQAPPAIRQQTLELMYDAAAGRASRKRKATTTGEQRENNPPAISGGHGFPLATTVNAMYQGKPLNATQKEILRMCHDSGITDKKRIKAMLDDAAEA